MVIFTIETNVTLDASDGWGKYWVANEHHARFLTSWAEEEVMIVGATFGDKFVGQVRVVDGVKMSSIALSLLNRIVTNRGQGQKNGREFY